MNNEVNNNIVGENPTIQNQVVETLQPELLDTPVVNDSKKNKNKKQLIIGGIILIILLLAAGSYFFFFNKYSNSYNLYVAGIEELRSNAIELVDDIDEDYLIKNSGQFLRNHGQLSFYSDMHELAGIEKLALGYDVELSLEDNEIVLGLSYLEENNELLNLFFTLINDTFYIESEKLATYALTGTVEDYIPYDPSDLDLNIDYNIDDVKYLINKTTEYYLNTLSEDNFTKTNKEFNGKNTTMHSYILTDEIYQTTINTILTSIKNDSKYLEILSKYIMIETNDLINEIDNSIDNLELIDNSQIEINIYTTGLFHDIEGITINSTENNVTKEVLSYKEGKESDTLVIGDNTAKFNIQIKDDTYTIKYFENNTFNETFGTITIKEDDNVFNINYNFIQETGENVEMNTTIKFNKENDNKLISEVNANITIDDINIGVKFTNSFEYNNTLNHNVTSITKDVSLLTTDDYNELLLNLLTILEDSVLMELFTNAGSLITTL